MIAFEQSRGREIREERQINHLCNRPFCLQPAHLYEGTALQNSADRKAELARGRYTDWRTMVERFDDALTQHHWPAPEPAGIAAGWGEPLEVPPRDHAGDVREEGTRGKRDDLRQLQRGQAGTGKAGPGGDGNPAGWNSPAGAQRTRDTRRRKPRWRRTGR